MINETFDTKEGAQKYIDQMTTDNNDKQDKVELEIGGGSESTE